MPIELIVYFGFTKYSIISSNYEHQKLNKHNSRRTWQCDYGMNFMAFEFGLVERIK